MEHYRRCEVPQLFAVNGINLAALDRRGFSFPPKLASASCELPNASCRR